MAQEHAEQPQRRLRRGRAAPGRWCALRNPTRPGGAYVTYTRAEITAFLQGVQDGEFDDLIAR